ncbi:ATP-binding cassette domain-containing protein [Campylobacter sp. CCUG 57310]|uniref:ATP-binding cassette domain-containing protein n=1 Tax=Campylobacter sp. CCUG 57310 TaxID=2517362 RepID=UPI0015662E9F|nr:ATP-binding cassette domain-containing protein [Campylobacter sp. CCUG 57310]QKF91268.1 ATP-binding cassette domain-containing protein [Campylobacter sp. CCUG 57310]
MKKIIYKGIRTNNLKNLDISITPNSLVCICGCSGSGKSSLAFDTMYAVSKNEINSLMNDDYEAGDCIIDFYDNILFSVALKQLNFNINPRSSILSYFHLSNELNLILSKLSTKYIKNATLLSPKNVCSECYGLGFKKEIDLDKVIDRNSNLKDNPFLPWLNSYKDFYTQILNLYIQDIGLDWSLKFYELSKESQHELLYKTSSKKYKINYKISGKTRVKTASYRGIMLDDPVDISEQYTKNALCQKCGGARLNSEINSIEILGYSLQDILLCKFCDLPDIFKIFKSKDIGIDLAFEKLDNFVQKCINLGLGHLNFSRSIPSLSGGELQRLRIAKILLGKINNIMIVLDEPTSSLHPSEVTGLVNEIEKLKRNNTVIVIEHNKELINRADNVFYIGPKSGKQGGEFITKQEYDESQKFKLKKIDFKSSVCQKIKLQNLDFLKFQGEITIDYNRLIGISSKSGVGKTSLLKHILPQYIDLYQYISQKPIKANINSNIATYTGIFDDIKQLFSANFLNDNSYFSKNSNTMCKKCGGSGRILVLEKYKSKFYNECCNCNGSGYNKNALKFKVFDMNIWEILSCNIDDLCKIEFPKKTREKLQLLDELGLSHLSLNRLTLNMSGGEQQRLKLFKAFFDKKNKIFGLDEPTKGLSGKDTSKIISLLYKYIQDKDKTFIVAEHNPLFLSHCNDIIELKRDGDVVKVVFNSRMEEIKNCKESEISNFLII